MDRRTTLPSSTRRGVVLILVLAMLSLLAIIGVSFATFSGQARYSSQQYVKKLAIPDAESMLDFGMSQLINDSTSPNSALYGHSLKRDLYGNDAFNHGRLDATTDVAGNPIPIQITANPSTLGSYPAVYQIQTNLRTVIGIDINRWIVTLPATGGTVAQTYEIVAWANVGGFYQMNIAGSHGVEGTVPFNGAQFTLASQYLRGMNGPGMAGLDAVSAAKLAGFTGNSLSGQFANYRVARGLLDPTYLPQAQAAPFDVNVLGTDEDYDAADLENWFLALQTADGEVVVPSFHRPGILSANDWLRPSPRAIPSGTPAYVEAVRSSSKILTPRAIDQANPTVAVNTFPNLIPTVDTTVPPDGIPDKIEYPVDNDGDGITDSVWLDLGYRPIRSPDGKLFKPLFSFMVVGLNGRIPLNTAGNLNARAVVDDPATTGDETGLPLFDHASHLGTSPSEINPKFALQNAVDTNAASGVTDATKIDNRQFQYGTPPAAANARATTVDLTQLRNLLTGTRLPGTGNFETDTVVVDGVSYPFPNNVADDATTGDPTGVPIPRSTQAVAGRWGEPDGIPQAIRSPSSTIAFTLNVQSLRGLLFSSVADNRVDGFGTPLNPLRVAPQPVRAGRSPFPNGQYLFDGIDDNYDAIDFYPALDGAGPRTGPETGDLVDAANRLLLPVDRTRRFLAPTDPTGNGRLMRFDGAPTLAAPFGLGTDLRGRVGFLHYYRPPGVSATYVPGSPTLQTDIPNAGTDANPSYIIQDSTLNVTHGYDAFRDPEGDNATRLKRFSASMPYNVSNAGMPGRPTDLFDTATNTYVGTFNPVTGISSDYGQFDPTTFQLVSPVDGYGFGGLRFNDPDEMDLYRPTTTDSPFGVEDLEYLYRGQDVDGSGLSSRLADLAPVSFELSAERFRNRRLFTTETWDRIFPTFANDNQLRNLDGGFADQGGQPTYNPALALALQPMNNYLGYGGPGTNPQFNIRYTNLASPTTYNASSATVNIHQGDRRINLNFPLIHSYDPFEPTRRKWITEAYELMKRVLPPQAIDTPQELARLGQYVVNIIDFRDPDNTMTIWANPDVRHLPARRVDPDDLPPSIHLPYRADGTPDPAYTDALSAPLVHHGFEYNPIAINEVLGYQFNYADPNKSGSNRNTRANRLFIELVNTLTKSDFGGGDFDDPNPSNLDMEGYDFVLVREDQSQDFNATTTPYFHPVYTRPDPITGQIPANALGNRSPVRPDIATATVAGQAIPVVVGSGEAVDITVPGTGNRIADDYVGQVLARPIASLRPDGDAEFYVMGGLKIDTTGGATPPANEDTIENNLPDPGDMETHFPIGDWDLIPDVNDVELDATLSVNGQGRYFWLYLRRPANLLAPPDPDPASPTYNPLLVVDSIRFPFSASRGTGQTSTTPPITESVLAPQSQPIYSIERYQPYRGGQLVPSPYPPAAVADPVDPLFIYGTSEQARPAQNGNGKTLYDDPTITGQVETTSELHESIGARNSQEVWDHVPFNDRDFMSVAELTLVSTSPPGMFTKRFVEDIQLFPLVVPQPLVDALPAVPDLTHDGPGAAAYNILPPIAGGTLFDRVADNGTVGVTEAIPDESVRAYPHLPHDFFYSSDPTATVDPLNALGNGATLHLAGGVTSAGWYRALEFFEVPASTLGAIGPVSQGVNLDWYRESQRPGQINLNLVVDEEVFFGLVDEPRMLDLTLAANNALSTGFATPQVVTQVNDDGTPSAGYALGLRPDATSYGFTLFQATSGDPTVVEPNDATLNVPFNQGMKPAFSDFVKQRHGGSGYVGAFGNGPTGTPFIPPAGPFVPSNPAVARDRPYRSLSYFDIQSTLLRPGTLNPSPFTSPIAGPGVFDPGIRNGVLEPGLVYSPDPSDPSSYFASLALPAGSPSPGSPVLAVPPPRRWFQVPDSRATFAGDGTPPPASLPGLTIGGNRVVNTPIDARNLSNNAPTDAPMTGYPPKSAPGPEPSVTSLFPEVAVQYLGGADATGGGDPDVDTRRQPLFQTELLQKMSNLTTVRTHQYAVWLTVGLFEVTKTGDPAKLIPDQLGRELGASSGSNTRYRSFFIVDRTRATGFNPFNPGDHRELIVYRRRIE